MPVMYPKSYSDMYVMIHSGAMKYCNVLLECISAGGEYSFVRVNIDKPKVRKTIQLRIVGLLIKNGIHQLSMKHLSTLRGRGWFRIT